MGCNPVSGLCVVWAPGRSPLLQPPTLSTPRLGLGLRHPDAALPNRSGIRHARKMPHREERLSRAGEQAMLSRSFIQSADTMCWSPAEQLACVVSLPLCNESARQLQLIPILYTRRRAQRGYKTYPRLPSTGIQVWAMPKSSRNHRIVPAKGFACEYLLRSYCVQGMVYIVACM